MPDVQTLQIIWWVLLGVIFTAFALTDGFDFGVVALMPALGKTDAERRLILRSIEPVWESNQVWLVLGAGAIFAAWPLIYAVAFSTMYLLMFLMLGCLIIRAAGLKFRDKMPGARWRHGWDAALRVTSLIPPFVFGLAVANAITGLPFAFAESMAIKTQGRFWVLFNPLALLAGLVSLNALIAHGAGYLRLKIDHPLTIQAARAQKIAAALALICFVASGFVLYFTGYGFVVTKAGAAQNVFSKVVETAPIEANPVMGAKFVRALIPAGLACLGFLLAIFSKRAVLGFIGSCVAIVCLIATAGFAAFPFILPSTLVPSHGLTVWDASSSRLTLFIMLIVVLIFLPLILAYVTWAYRVFSKRLGLSDLDDRQIY